MLLTTIRRACPADARLVAALGARTFADTFGHLYAPQDLAAFLEAAHTPEKVAGELAAPHMAVWLAETAGGPVGYALAGACGLPHPEVTAGCGEIKRIYVLDEAQGAGLGARLMDEALAWLAAEGRAPVWLGVWSQNLAAQRFYVRYGFSKVGEYDFHVGAQVDHEFIMRRN
ncbi:MAG TPA: N-acetyltransferase [Caulobacteraceae bacterium]